MKASVAITLIVMGTLVILAPAIGDYLHQRQAVALLQRPEVQSVTLEGRMSDLYRFGCWGAGVLMIGCGVVCSLSAGRRRQPGRTAD